MADVLPVNPNAQAVTSESLSALWILQWTTEREILFLMEKGLLGLRSGPVQQAIDVDARTLSNTMLFGPDSFFDVSSSIDPEVSLRKGLERGCRLPYAGRCRYHVVFACRLPKSGAGTLVIWLCLMTQRRPRLVWTRATSLIIGAA